MRRFTFALIFIFVLTACGGSSDSGGGKLFDGSSNISNPSQSPSDEEESESNDPIQITSVAMTSGNFGEGDQLTISVQFNRSADISGSPFINVDIDGSIEQASFNSGSGTATITFVYNVASGDNDSDGVSLTTSIDLNGGSITDSEGEDLGDLNFSAIDTSTVLVDTTSPAEPTITGTVEVSPNSSDASPTILGTAENSASINIFTDSSCGVLVASGNADISGNFSIAAPAQLDEVTETYYANQVDLAGNISSCSSSSISYEKFSIVTGYGVFRSSQSSNGTNINETTAYPLLWNESNYYDNTHYSISGGSNISFSQSGNYLISVTVPQTSSLQRSNVVADLYHNGVVVLGARGNSSYIRNQAGHREASSHFTFLLEGVAVNDTIEVMVQRQAVAGTVTIDGNATIIVEKVNDGRTIFTASSTKTTSSTNLNQTSAFNLEWSESLKDSSFTHDDSVDPQNITLSSSGEYFVSFNIPITASVTRGNLVAEVKLNGTRIPGGAASQGYIRNASDHNQSSLHFSGLVTGVSAGDILTISTRLEGGAGTITTDSQASLFIEHLDTSSDIFYARATELSGGSNWNPTSKENILWQTSVIKDSGVYSHSVSSSSQNITVTASGDYQLFYNDYLTSTLQRPNPKITVEVNGAPIEGAVCTTHYIRGSSGHNDSSCNLSVFLRNLAAGDIITVSSQAEALTGTVNDSDDALLLLWRK